MAMVTALRRLSLSVAKKSLAPPISSRVSLYYMSSLPSEAVHDKDKSRITWTKVLNEPLEGVDPEIADIIELEKTRQWKGLEKLRTTDTKETRREYPSFFDFFDLDPNWGRIQSGPEYKPWTKATTVSLQTISSALSLWWSLMTKDRQWMKLGQAHIRICMYFHQLMEVTKLLGLRKRQVVMSRLQPIGRECLAFRPTTHISMDPLQGDFRRKIDSYPDLYGPVWISTTLVFMLAALGNCGTYLMNRKSVPDTAWVFDVNYVNWAASVVYGYALLVPVAFYFLLQYFGCSASLTRFWCLWGYSLFIFIPSSLLLVFPDEFLRWLIILVAGAASSVFIGINLKSYTEESDMMVICVSAMVLQFVLALFIKFFFYA